PRTVRPRLCRARGDPVSLQRLVSDRQAGRAARGDEPAGEALDACPPGHSSDRRPDGEVFDARRAGGRGGHRAGEVPEPGARRGPFGYGLVLRCRAAVDGERAVCPNPEGGAVMNEPEADVPVRSPARARSYGWRL